MATIAQARDYLLRVRAEAGRPMSFYRTHYIFWRELAMRVAGQTLERLKPPNVRMEAWTAAVARSLETVATALIDEDGVGARIWMLRQIEPSVPGGASPYNAIVPFETIVDWVAAGRAGDPLGKNLRESPGEIDYGKTDRQIAWRVFHAIRLGKSPGLTAAVKSFQENSGDAQVLLVFDHVQAAWEEFFAVQAPDDFRKWLASVIRE